MKGSTKDKIKGTAHEVKGALSKRQSAMLLTIPNLKPRARQRKSAARCKRRLPTWRRWSENSHAPVILITI